MGKGWGGWVGGHKKLSSERKNVPINSTLYLMDVSDGTAVRSLCNHSGLATLSFATPSRLTNVVTLQPSRTRKLALAGCVCAGEHEMDWSADAKAARQRGSAEGRGRLCHQPPTALVKAIQSILAFSSAWPSTELSVCPGESDGWTHCSFQLHPKQRRREKDLTNTQIWLFWHIVGWG